MRTFFKLFQRYRKHARMNANTNRPNSPHETTQVSLNSRKSKSLAERSSQFDLASIPKIFLSPNLELSRRDNFETVFPFTKDGLLNVGSSIVVHVKLMQEKVRSEDPSLRNVKTR